MRATRRPKSVRQFGDQYEADFETGMAAFKMPRTMRLCLGVQADACFVCSFMPAAYPLMTGSPEKLRFGSGIPGFAFVRAARLVCWGWPRPLIRTGPWIGQPPGPGVRT